MSNNGAPRKIRRKEVPRFQTNDYYGENMTVNTRSTNKVKFPLYPPRQLTLRDVKTNKNWVFEAESSPQLTARGNSQPVVFKSKDGGVIFSVMYDKKGAGAIKIINLYFSKPKDKGSVPASAVVAVLKRSDNKKLNVENSSSVPAPNRTRLIPRSLLPKYYNLYPGFYPSPHDVLPQEIPVLTDALLRNNKQLTPLEVEKLLSGLVSKNNAKTLANATKKKLDLPELYDVLNSTGLLEFGNIPLNRTFKI